MKAEIQFKATQFSAMRAEDLKYSDFPWIQPAGEELANIGT